MKKNPSTLSTGFKMKLPASVAHKCSQYCRAADGLAGHSAFLRAAEKSNGTVFGTAFGNLIECANLPSGAAIQYAGISFAWPSVLTNSFQGGAGGSGARC